MKLTRAELKNLTFELSHLHKFELSNGIMLTGLLSFLAILESIEYFFLSGEPRIFWGIITLILGIFWLYLALIKLRLKKSLYSRRRGKNA